MISNKLMNLPAMLCLGLTCACSSEETADPNANASWSISSPAFAAGAEIPKEYTCDGRAFAVGASPELAWTAGPAGTKSYALVVKHLAIVESVDPSSPDYAKGFMWAIWDIPASTLELPANLGRAALLPEVPGAQQWSVRNQFGYFAPCPNADPATAAAAVVTDRYAFTLYALDTPNVALPLKEANVNNYTLTLTKHLDAVNIGTTELRAVSSAIAGEPIVPVDPATIVFPAGTVP
jgi:phosphatidylethanolamine-binding protein (PEBP) family uncharacterized protein